ncbi:MAG: lytic transglycosylase domain-containing protein [Acidobacteriota bacterium]|nr:lytic transglycosylase domain-containing protein [Acidobacteriota bacterium]
MTFFPICIFLAVVLLPAAAQQNSAATQVATQGNASDVAAKQSVSVEKMNGSIEKQKAAAQSQVGAGGSADSFFTASWITPAAIPVPTIIPACQPMPEDELKALIADSAKTHGVKPEVIRAVIRRESDSYACAVSDKGALGLMQLLPEVAQQFGANPLDPKQNVQAGTKYLKQLMTRYKGDLRLALAAYNAGPQRVDADKKVPDIPETIAYVEAILKDLTPTASPQR